VLTHHQHQHAYAAIVLSGGYEEAGDCGRFHVEAGDVVLHDRFEAHINRYCLGATVLNFPVPLGSSIAPGRAKLDDSYLVTSASKLQDDEAVAALLESTHHVHPQPPTDWPDILACDMVRDPSLRLSRWSEPHGIAQWSVSRGFCQVFGIPPSVFRRRARARHAWNELKRALRPSLLSPPTSALRIRLTCAVT
jgi:AraC-like DNA-binding protein